MSQPARVIAGHASSSAVFAEGIAAAGGAFAIWGLFPLYLKALQSVPIFQIMAHRVVWCCVLVVGWLAWRGELGKVRAALTNPSTRWLLMASGTLISINWLVYVWGVANSHVVETSLGYFINPLVNVLLGVLVLSERLNRAQWVAVTLAAIAVVYLTSATGQLPWISLVLAVSFGIYGLVRKVITVDSVPALATETLLILPLAAGFLIWCETIGTAALGHSNAAVNALLLGSGAATAIPLILFAFGARRIPLSTVGLMQYIAPSLQLALGVLLYGEPFGRTRFIGFALIWLALIIYAVDGLWRARQPRPVEAT
jgi:chloramphenicol-sensitive protein RarD